MGLDIIPTQDWWIGANDLWKVKNDFMQKKTVRKKSFQEGAWNWERNGSHLTYTNWENGQPNNQNGHQDCLEFQDYGHWNDEDCNDHHRPICQKFTPSTTLSNTSPSTSTTGQ